MRSLFLTAIAGCVAWSSPALAEKYQLLPVITHMGGARLDCTALLLDAATGIAFNCSAQFDAKLLKFSGEAACLAVSVECRVASRCANLWLEVGRRSAIRRSYLLHRAFDHSGRRTPMVRAGGYSQIGL
jgi:hypothetical protein